jgi:FG-GAP-like repeat/Secretion system C-terminal sorting domain
MKNLKSNLIVIVLFVFSIMISNEVSAQSYSLEQPVMVPFYRGTIVSNTMIDVFWDVSEINEDNNRLDLALGLSQFGYTPVPFAEYNYVVGNWYENQNDSNFNEEDPDLRFINQSSNAITGLLFAKLNSDTAVKKELIVTRGDGKVYRFLNTNGAISTSNIQTIHTANGTVASVGKFTTDDNEDIAVISGSDVKIYKSLGNGSLDTTAVYTLSSVSANKVLISQVSSYIYPYSVINNTTSDRDEIIILSGTNIKIYLNDNNNGTSTITTISSLDQFTDFKIADIDNDGYNDLITTSAADGIKIFKNTAGTISSSAYFTNNADNNSRNIEVADFDKDGWNDLVVATQDSVKIFLNSSGSFSETPSYSLNYSNITYLKGRKLAVKDLENEGGLTVLFSGTLDINAPSNPYYPNEAPFDDEDLIRFNPATIDANPAPAYLFKNTVVVSGKYRPKLLLFNRGDRDFLKYKIYKKSPFTNYIYTLIDSTTNNYYIDTVETLDTTSNPGGVPSPNLFYYVKAEDNSYKVSSNSDTLGYPSVLCPTCPNGPDNFVQTNELNNLNQPKEYSITNFPNPFNPSTKIKFEIPEDVFVSIKVYDALGKEIRTLVNEFKNAGSYTVTLDGNNLSSGIYYYRFETRNGQTGSFTATRKMLLLK